MLVLSRFAGQKLVIDDEIVLTIIEIRDDKVRIGIDAPKGVPVHREEVWLAIQNGDVDETEVRRERP